MRNGPTEPISLSYTEILQTCMDKVSIGDKLQTIVNTQATYDSLIYARFQKPLDDYWSANYDTVLYYVRQNHPGLSDSEYAVLVRQVFYSTLPFMGTDTCSQPAINFQRYTLLGQDAYAGGCKIPDYQITLLRDDAKKEIIYRIKIIEHGYCKMAINRNKWILVPKIPKSFRVIFKKEYTKG